MEGEQEAVMGGGDDVLEGEDDAWGHEDTGSEPSHAARDRVSERRLTHWSCALLPRLHTRSGLQLSWRLRVRGWVARR